MSLNCTGTVKLGIFTTPLESLCSWPYQTLYNLSVIVSKKVAILDMATWFVPCFDVAACKLFPSYYSRTVVTVPLELMAFGPFHKKIKSLLSLISVGFYH